MPLDLRPFESELAGLPLRSPVPRPLAIAIVSDCWRLAGRVPPTANAWDSLGAKPDALEEQVGVLAHLLGTESLRTETLRAMGAGTADPTAALRGFFAAIAPLTAEMVRANAFRREELVRHWLAWISGAIAGETPEQSQQRLDQLDYRKALAEYDRAQKARQAEAEKRAQLLKEAAEREAAARGWRE